MFRNPYVKDVSKDYTIAILSVLLCRKPDI